jgi:hypothetical protein
MLLAAKGERLHGKPQPFTAQFQVLVGARILLTVAPGSAHIGFVGAVLPTLCAFLPAKVHGDFVRLHRFEPIFALALELQTLGLNSGDLLAESGARREIGESLE